MKRVRSYVLLAVSLALWPGSAGAIDGARSAIAEDPAIDVKNPASGQGVRFESHGAGVNAQIYRPAGAGAHPVAVLLHGLPGNEQNLDLARALQRAGWTVVTFHYRGSWGSGGRFSLKAGIEDVEALLDRIEQPDTASAWGADPSRIVILGHSYGGLAAASAVKARPRILAAALIAPWDPSEDARAWATLSDTQRMKAFVGDANDIDGRLGPVTASLVLREIMRDSRSLDLARFAPALALHPLLVVTATRDDRDDQALGLLEALKKTPAADVTAITMPTDHGFNDHRIALETAVLAWLAKLPGAP